MKAGIHISKKLNRVSERKIWAVQIHLCKIYTFFSNNNTHVTLFSGAGQNLEQRMMGQTKHRYLWTD